MELFKKKPTESTCFAQVDQHHYTKAAARTSWRSTFNLLDKAELRNGWATTHIPLVLEGTLESMYCDFMFGNFLNELVGGEFGEVWGSTIPKLNSE